MNIQKSKSSGNSNRIEIRGARTNNLKNLDLDIPQARIISLVGVSGAGKTSLAFHTLYAEGYLRYIESISPYIRQFLEKIEKPRVERIDGLPPAIAFRHRKSQKNPRSIVATASDLYDYFRLLYAKIADFFCPDCGEIVDHYSIDEIVDLVLAGKPETVTICFEYSGEVAYLVNRGYYFYFTEGERVRIDKEIKGSSIDVIIDRLDISSGNRSRLFEALDQSISMNRDRAVVYMDEMRTVFPTDLFCPRCQTHFQSADENLFSFNSPRGACQQCNGFGDLQQLDEDLIFNRDLSLSEGAVLPLKSKSMRRFRKRLFDRAEDRGIDLHQPLRKLSDEEMRFLMDGDGRFRGIRGFFSRIRRKSYKVQARVFLSRYTSYRPCPSCLGSRLNPLALSFKIAGKSIADLLSLTIEEADEFFRSLEWDSYRTRISRTVFEDVRARLRFLRESGLHYIHLNRLTFTLSRGEFQRINLAFILGSALSDSLLIIDQPSSDLHPHDYGKLLRFLTDLKTNGNTVLLVEHNQDIVSHSDTIIELGPLAGEKGGRLVFCGERDRFFTTGETLTQRHFNRPFQIKTSDRAMDNPLRFSNATTHNLKGFSFHIPLQTFTIIAGVSGAGKTTLLRNEIFEKHSGKDRRSVFIDPGISNVRANSHIAGYFDIYTTIRTFYARLEESRLHSFLPGHFSFNSPLGRCEACKGKGYSEIEMQFLPAVKIPCENCASTGFKPEVLKIKYRKHSIAGILDQPVETALEILGEAIPAIHDTLHNLVENGMGYLRLGQRLNTLSMGELQRIKLVKYLDINQTETLFLIDEPTFGLHYHDIGMLKRLIDNLIENGNTVVAADHNFDLIAYSDYLIELGPEGGEKGGYLVYEGPTAAVFSCRESITAHHLKKKAGGLDKQNQMSD